MPAIGDQVANLEHDHTEALAMINALMTTNAALAADNVALANENAALNKYADEIKAMVESVASGALKMLQAAQAPIVLVAPATPAPLVLNVKGFLGDTPIATGLTKPETGAATPEELDEQDAGNANAISSGDSGDEHRPIGKSPLLTAPYGSAGLRASDLTDDQLSDHVADVAIDAGYLLTLDQKSDVVAAARGINAKISNVVSTVEAKIADLPDAVERMLQHSSASSAPPVTAIRMPVDMTMIVEHDPGGLPLFLRRGTTFDALARARHST